MRYHRAAPSHQQEARQVGHGTGRSAGLFVQGAIGDADPTSVDDGQARHGEQAGMDGLGQRVQKRGDWLEDRRDGIHRSCVGRRSKMRNVSDDGCSGH